MRWKRYTLQVLVIVFLVLNILFPSAALSGAKAGLQLFLQTVLPALLPFFAATTMFVRSGLAHKLSGLLSPLMRPLFRLPGASALAFVLCLFGGNPNGSRVTSELFEQGLLSKAESERTVALASTAGPAFIFSVVLGDMLKAPQYGALLWGCHVLSAIATCQISSLFVSRSDITKGGKKPRHIRFAPEPFTDFRRQCQGLRRIAMGGGIVHHLFFNADELVPIDGIVLGTLTSALVCHPAARPIPSASGAIDQGNHGDHRRVQCRERSICPDA